jgi:hypothetical protein
VFTLCGIAGFEAAQPRDNKRAKAGISPNYNSRNVKNTEVLEKTQKL